MSDEVTREEKQAIERWLARNNPTVCTPCQYTDSVDKPDGGVKLKRGIKFGKGRG